MSEKQKQELKEYQKQRYPEAKESKNNIFLPCRCHLFPWSIQILKRPKCEIAPPEAQIDVRCMHPRFEDSPYYAWSIRQDVGQVIHRETFQCSSYDALLVRGHGPDSAGTCPFTSIWDAMKTACVELVKNTL